MSVDYGSVNLPSSQLDNEQLCSACIKMSIKSNLRHRSDVWARRSIETIFPPQGAKTHAHCALCRLLARSVPPEHRNRMRKLYLQDFGDAQTIDGNACKLLGFQQRLLLGSQQDKSQNLRIVPLAEDAHMIGKSKEGFARPLLPDAVDSNLLKTWLATCERNHEPCMSAAKELKLATEGSGAEYLINVQDMCVEKVKDQDSPRYFALSYVWGNTKQLQLQLLQANAIALQCKNSLQDVYGWQIPQTIRHAMTLTRDLGETYLWVDAFCICQDDLVQRDRQIKRMNMIYKHAVLTIVALEAKSASDPLPGVRTYDPQRVNQEEIFKGMRLTTLLPTLEELIADLASDGPWRWSQRLWTYQEELLSRRLLFLTSRQAYFTCLTSEYSEDVYDTKIPKTSSLHYGRLLHTPLEPFQRWVFWRMLVENYSTRHSKFPIDRGFAFQGIAQEMERLWKYPTVYGIPKDRIPFVLNWQHGRYPFRNLRNTVCRIPEWPSWSWMGWSGEISCPEYPFYRSAIGEVTYCDAGRETSILQFPVKASDIDYEPRTTDLVDNTQENEDLEAGLATANETGVGPSATNNERENALIRISVEEGDLPAIPILSFETFRVSVKTDITQFHETGRYAIITGLGKVCGFLYAPHRLNSEEQHPDPPATATGAGEQRCECILLGTSRRFFYFHTHQYKLPAKPKTGWPFDDQLKPVIVADKTRHDTTVGSWGHRNWSERARRYVNLSPDTFNEEDDTESSLSPWFYISRLILIIVFCFILPLFLLGWVVRVVFGITFLIVFIIALVAAMPIKYFYLYCFKPIWLRQDRDVIAHVMWIEDRGTHYERVAVGEMNWKCWLALKPRKSRIRLG